MCAKIVILLALLALCCAQLRVVGAVSDERAEPKEVLSAFHSRGILEVAEGHPAAQGDVPMAAKAGKAQSPVGNGRKLLQSGCFGKFCVRFKNLCYLQVEFVIYYKTLSGAWVSNGFWELDQYETAYVADTRNRYFYYYAETDPFRIVWDGPYTRRFNSKNLYFNHREVDFGSTFGYQTINLKC